MDFAIQKTFSSEEIRRIRKRLNLKQKDFAKFMNVSVKTIEHWEKMGGEIKGAGAALENLFTKYLEKTISIRDTFVRKPTKENFYHGILLGILGFKKEM